MTKVILVPKCCSPMLVTDYSDSYLLACSILYSVDRWTCDVTDRNVAMKCPFEICSMHNNEKMRGPHFRRFRNFFMIPESKLLQLVVKLLQKSAYELVDNFYMHVQPILASSIGIHTHPRRYVQRNPSKSDTAWWVQ